MHTGNRGTTTTYGTLGIKAQLCYHVVPIRRYLHTRNRPPGQISIRNTCAFVIIKLLARPSISRRTELPLVPGSSPHRTGRPGVGVVAELSFQARPLEGYYGPWGFAVISY